MVRLELESSLMDCPKVWQNFIEDLTRAGLEDRISSGGFTVKTLNHHLNRFGASYLEENNFIDFADERYYTMFILRYGA